MKLNNNQFKIIYCFWFGDKMSEARFNCLSSITKNSKVEVKIITEKNLNVYILDKCPLHLGFQYLSSTHKSDYLRSYFMYYYGGGYTDIKQCEFDWNPYFDYLLSTDYEFIGYSENNPKHVSNPSLKHCFNELAGPTQFIFKENSNFAKDWFFLTRKKMDNVYNDLKLFPGTYHPRAERGGVQGEKGIFTNSKYPLKWTELLGDIFHNLSYNNIGKFNTTMPYPNIINYR